MLEHGFLNLCKPKGMTSHACVAKLRYLLKTKHIGHAGTLDPMATGVLPIAVNRATKFIQFLHKAKAYDGTIRFGVTTDSDDITGNVLLECPVPELTHARVEAALRGFVGNIIQRPPVVSAIRVDGERLYHLARTGKATLEDVPLRHVTVNSIQLHTFTPGDYPEVTISVDCSEGTYIRSIARECGEVLLVQNGDIPAGATLAALHRTRSNGLTHESSVTLEQVERGVQDGTLVLTPPEALLQHLPRIHMSPAVERVWRNGQALLWPLGDVMDATPSTSPMPTAVYSDSSVFLGVTTLTLDADASRYSITGSRLQLHP